MSQGSERRYCDSCQKETIHVAVDSPGKSNFTDFYACFECGGDTKRLYEGGRRLETPIKLTPELSSRLRIKERIEMSECSH